MGMYSYLLVRFLSQKRNRMCEMVFCTYYNVVLFTRVLCIEESLNAIRRVVAAGGSILLRILLTELRSSVVTGEICVGFRRICLTPRVLTIIFIVLLQLKHLLPVFQCPPWIRARCEFGFGVEAPLWQFVS